MADRDDVDYRAYYDAKYVRAWDLPAGHDVTVTIDRVEGEIIKGVDKEDKRPVLYFRGKQKGLVLNKGMGKTVKGMYGRFVRDWIGKSISLYGTSVNAFGEVHDVVRIRPKVPAARKPSAPNGPAAALPPGPVHDGEFVESESEEVAS